MSQKTVSCCGGREIGQATSRRADENPLGGILPSAIPVKHRWSGPLCGKFVMGTDDPGAFSADGEGPPREVVLSEFSISCYAVTNAQFADFVRATGYVTDAERFGWSFVFDGLIPAQMRRPDAVRSAETPWWIKLPRAYWAQPEGPHSNVLARTTHPVVHVSWNDAVAYCCWSQTRLPTEAEWEFAARGGLKGALYPWGDDLAPGGEHRCNIWQGSFPDRNTADDGYFGTAPADAYQPNGYGLYNAAGNVWEWCADYFSSTYHRRTGHIDPLYDQHSDNRSMRGGSFLCHHSYCNRYRVAARSSNTPDSSSSNIGFRVVRVAA